MLFVLQLVPRRRGVPTCVTHIEAGLTIGLDLIAADADPRRRCQWLGVFAEAAAISDDERLVDSVRLHLSPTIDGLERSRAIGV